jgi:hypothetical protein
MEEANMPSLENVLLLCAAAFGQGAGVGEIDISVFIALRANYGKLISENLTSWEKDKAAVLQWCRTMGQTARKAAGTSTISESHVATAAGGCPYCTG